jgi:hypothetical protein
MRRVVERRRRQPSRKRRAVVLCLLANSGADTLAAAHPVGDEHR